MQSQAHNQLKHQIQQPLFKLTASSASHSPLTSNSYFASPIKSVSHGHQLNIRPVNSPSSNYFRPNTPRQKERETEKVEKERAQSAERIQTLHTRLHQEAEKIRKWKTSTEIEIKEKEKKLQEAVQTIDSQRKSIIELQFQNESLSTRLQEELANREEVEHKIISTRDMCNALKDHVAKVEGNLQRGESDRDELRFEEKKRLEQFQELVVKFQDLEIQHTAKYNEIKVTLEEKIKDHKQYVLESSEKMDKAESQTRLLENEKKAKESHIATMEAALENSKEEMTFLEHQLESLQDKVKKQESVITSQQVQIQNTEEMLRLNAEECKRKEDERKAIQSQFEDSQQLNQTLKDSVLEMKKEQRLVLDELETQLSSLIEEKQKLEESLQDLNVVNATATEKMKGLQVELETVTREKEKVNTLNSHILKEKGELEKACADLQANLAKEMERTTSKAEIIRQSKENLAHLQEKNSSLKNSLDQAQKEREELKEKIRLLTLASEEKQRTISDLEGKLYNANYNQKYLSENVQDLQEKISEERKEKEELQKSIGDLRASERKLKEQISSLEENESVLEKKLMGYSEGRKESEKVIERLQEEHQNLREQYDKMKEDIMMQDEERTLILEKERGNTRTLKDDLKERIKQIESLEAKIKSLQEQLAAKTKQSKEVQQENKTLKSKVTTQTKNADKSENQKSKLASELSACKEQIKDLTHKLKQSDKEEEAARNHSAEVNAKMEALKEELSMKSKELEKREEEVKRFKEETEEAMKEKESIQQKSEKQMNELCATLEKYKLENEKIVAQKERELELLRAQAATESQNQHSKQLKEANEQVDRLEKEVRRLRVMQQKDDQRSQIEISETVALLKKQLEEKNEDIKLLQGKIERQDKKPSKIARESSSERNPATPKVITPQPPAVVPETLKQPRSILKQKDSSQKKRRVMFAGSDELHFSSSEEDENELNLTKLGTKDSKSDTKETREKENKKTTPRTNVRFSPKPSPWKNEPSWESKSPFTEVQKLKQIPRGKPIAQQKQKKMKIQSEETEEMAKFKELFPDMSSPDSLYDKSPGNGRGLRQTTRPPFKSKITKIKPISRKKDNKESTSWFDSDSLFGFGMEDE